jgi:hypothetical protein
LTLFGKTYKIAEYCCSKRCVSRNLQKVARHYRVSSLRVNHSQSSGSIVNYAQQFLIPYFIKVAKSISKSPQSSNIDFYFTYIYLLYFTLLLTLTVWVKTSVIAKKTELNERFIGAVRKKVSKNQKTFSSGNGFNFF